jgi:acetyl-CoA carboxylase/biotin carboxylase 1
LVDIIGREDGLGVENLRGSGLIAGETSRAYEDIFTMTLVTGRTVGIGAYLIRLGQRTVQNEGPILLTGAPALNKVLGREVYTSNVQLGGPQIMYANGVSHVAVNDDLKAVAAILHWLGYIPRARGLPLPILPIGDPIDRPVEFTPRLSTPYDPRHLLAGFEDPDGRWVTGFFDRGSFTETLAGWAKTVVCGRARLGGIPLGVIIAETRMMERVIPADPANQESQQSVVQQAGGVWFPDSAYKTAQAIKDFNQVQPAIFHVRRDWLTVSPPGRTTAIDYLRKLAWFFGRDARYVR